MDLRAALTEALGSLLPGLLHDATGQLMESLRLDLAQLRRSLDEDFAELALRTAGAEGGHLGVFRAFPGAGRLHCEERCIAEAPALAEGCRMEEELRRARTEVDLSQAIDHFRLRAADQLEAARRPHAAAGPHGDAAEASIAAVLREVQDLRADLRGCDGKDRLLRAAEVGRPQERGPPPEAAAELMRQLQGLRRSVDQLTTQAAGQQPERCRCIGGGAAFDATLTTLSTSTQQTELAASADLASAQRAEEASPGCRAPGHAGSGSPPKARTRCGGGGCGGAQVGQSFA